MNKSKLFTHNILASEAVLVLAAETRIDAPAAVVFRALRNTDTWRDWNRWVPKVTINFQPPEDETATAGEIQELIRNTSIAGSFYSDLTDGGIGVARQRSPDEQPPPPFRLNSVSSRRSQGNQPKRASIDNSDLINSSNRASVSSVANGGKSSAQESQAERSYSEQEPASIANRVGNRDPHRASIIMPPLSPTSPTSPTSTGGKSERKASKPKYTQTVGYTDKSLGRAHQAYMSVYGEPSVRLQIRTKLTLHVRMKPNSPSDYTDMNIVVIDVVRPDDAITEKGTRPKTRTLDREGLYRVVWANDTESTSLFNVSALLRGVNVPKSMLQAERVHEIEPTGSETCVYRTWELQKGHAAKTNKKKHGEYMQKMFEVWCSGLRDFCEGLHAPQIDRRDFSISLDEAPVVISALT